MNAGYKRFSGGGDLACSTCLVSSYDKICIIVNNIGIRGESSLVARQSIVTLADG